MTALGFDWGKVRIVPQSVIDGIPTQSFALPPSVKPSDVFLGVDQGEGGPKDVRSVVARDVLVAGWLLQEQGLASVNGGIARNMGDGFGVADIVYGEVRLDVGFLEALYGWQGLSSNVRVAMLPGNPTTGAVRIPVADPSIVNSFSLPDDDNFFPLEIHVELNCWHEQTRSGNPGTRQKAIGLGPHPTGWVHQSFDVNFPDCWWPFRPFDPDNTGTELVGGEYVLIRGTLWQDGSHTGNPQWNVGVTKGQNGWLEIHPVDLMARIPSPGLVKTGVEESYAGGPTRRSNLIGPMSESATPLRVAAHESVTDARFTMFATLTQQTATDEGSGLRVITVVNPVGGQPVRYKGGHVATWSLPSPAICSTDPNADRLEIVARGRDDACWLRRLDPAAGGWQAWETLGGVLTSDPAATTVGGVLTVVVRGTDGALYWKWYRRPGDSSGWQLIPGPVPGEPTVPLSGRLPEPLRPRL
jgi:hypothetical protein